MTALAASIPTQLTLAPGGGKIPQNEHLTVIAHKPIKIGVIEGNGPLFHQLLPFLPVPDIVYCTERRPS